MTPGARRTAMVLMTILGLVLGTLAQAQERKGWAPPSDDPSRITKQDYLRVLVPYADRFEKQFRSLPSKADGYAYQAVPVFAALWKATGDARYPEMALNAIEAYGLYVKEEIPRQAAKVGMDSKGRPASNFYWTSYYVYLVVPVLQMRDAPNYGSLARRLGAILLARAKAFPVYWEIGPQNRAFFPGFWYDAASFFSGGTGAPEAMRSYSDAVWRSWWIPRDVGEDDPHYTAIDLAVLDAWGELRHALWWKDPKAAILWRDYAEQIANDGTWPPYGDGGAYGEYFIGLRTAELVASRLGDGRYKWLAHRAFWNGRDRLPALVAGIGLEKLDDLALAYLYADDSITEAAPQRGLTVTMRSFRERTDWSRLAEGAAFYVLHEDRAPSKLIFRGGSDVASQFLLVQAGSAAGHGHPDTGSVIFYGGNFNYYLSHGISRLDYAMERHNMLVLEDPAAKDAWRQGDYAVESTSVPVSGTARDASYARLEITAYPGTEATEEAWRAVKSWDGKGYPPRKAVGYRNWPAQLDRSILFVHDRFAVVRDVVRFFRPVQARVGQNWVVGDVDTEHGEHWFDVHASEFFGYPYSDPPKARVDVGDGRLLVWFAPRTPAGARLVTASRYSTYGNYYINLPNRVWEPVEGSWPAGQELCFTTVLFPHDAADAGRKVAERIELVRDSVHDTVLEIRAKDGDYLVRLGKAGTETAVGDIRTNAEAALVSRDPSGARFASWGASQSSWRDQPLKASAHGVDEQICAGADCMDR